MDRLQLALRVFRTSLEESCKQEYVAAGLYFRGLLYVLVWIAILFLITNLILSVPNLRTELSGFIYFDATP
jgi:hypothetical protein